MARMRGPDKAQLQETLRRTSLERDCLRVVLTDLLEMRPYVTVAPEYYPEHSTWQDGPQGAFRATIHRPESATGGYVVVMQRPAKGREMVHSIDYLEDWLDKTQRFIRHVSVSDDEGMALARLWYAVKREQHAALSAEAS
jgi:hypothetical protein